MWWGFLDNTSRSRYESILSRLKKLKYLLPNQHKNFAELCNNADSILFKKLMSNKNHVLHHLLHRLKIHPTIWDLGLITGVYQQIWVVFKKRTLSIGCSMKTRFNSCVLHCYLICFFNLLFHVNIVRLSDDDWSIYLLTYLLSPCFISGNEGPVNPSVHSSPGFGARFHPSCDTSSTVSFYDTFEEDENRISRMGLTKPTIRPTISLGSHQNIGLHTGARANVVLLTYLLTFSDLGFTLISQLVRTFTASTPNENKV